MKITIKAKPSAKQNSVEKLPDGTYLVRVKAQARDGKANTAVIEALSAHFDRPKSFITILRGQSGKTKLVEVS